ncbi:hypothetical protein KFK09_003947 [Dendrobium nobile]|uniref:Reverse transcriptase domain-containing protein n=1 Tax=Dendrobium nobile TaxID=94219 RepID=A0A8T3C2M7_DENNO|nr:hypothetical protein KFK09_003947 [Dendrobium nobile]
MLGVKVTPSAPRISHLLFADDILMFSEGRMGQLREFKKLISEYCSWTGQSVNKLKSSILFGKAVKNNRRRKISRFLGFNEVKEMQYLGFKNSLRRRIGSNFLSLLGKAVSKLDVWGNKFFSLAGRILLVKSVILSIPLFYITTSLIPLSILRRFEKICREFLWNKKNWSHGMHFIPWEEMCKSVQNGGRGIHSVINMVGPLRAKFA